MKSDPVFEAYEKYSRLHLKNYQTSELAYAVRIVLEALYPKISALLASEDDVKELFGAMPGIISGLDCGVEQTPLGREYNFADSVLHSKAVSAGSLPDFIASATGEQARPGPARPCFEKFVDENPYSGPAEFFRAVLDYPSGPGLASIFRKLGIKRPKGESCFHCAINDVPVFVSIVDGGDGAGRVEIDIVNRADPRAIDGGSAAARDVLEAHFRKLNVRRSHGT